MAAKNINNELFQKYVQEDKNTVLVEYWAPWCGYCRRIGPAYDKISDQYKDQILVTKVNIDEEPQLAENQQIEVVPTLVLYKDGKDAGSIVAPDSKARIDSFIRETLTL